MDAIVGIDQVLLELAKFAGSLEGASLLLIVVGLAQLLMKAFQSPLGNLAGKYRLLAVAAFNAVLVLGGGMVAGLSLFASALSAAGLVALQVLVDQIYKQFFVKED